MARYVIGDIHGCGDEFELLLSQLSYNPSVDQVYLAGDLCGRGPKPLKVLDLAMHYDLPIVFGNWDIHLLSCMFGVRQASEKDNFGSIFEQDPVSFKRYRDWLLQHEFVINDPNFLLVHASVQPTWTEAQILAYAAHAKSYFLDLTQHLDQFKVYFGGKFIQALSQDQTCNPELRRCIESIMVFTINRVQQLRTPIAPAQIFSQLSATQEFEKLQACYSPEQLAQVQASYSTLITDYEHSFLDFELKEKGHPVYDPEHYKFSWYMWEEFLTYLQQQDNSVVVNNPNLVTHNLGKPIYFGHWSMLNGHQLTPGYICTDTSCVYGDRLSAYLLPEQPVDMTDHPALLALAQPYCTVKNCQGKAY